VVKNKMAPPFREAEFEILYGVGVNKLGEIADQGEKSGLLDKSGAWFSYKGKNLAQGREKLITYLGENPSIAQEIRLSLIENAKAECQMAPAASLPAGTALAALNGANGVAHGAAA
jgi:recombination protein RecA